MRNANGYGSIYKLKNRKLRKPFIVRSAAKLDERGIYVRTVIGRFATKNEAMIFLANYNAMNNNLDSSEFTLGQLFERWKISKHANSISEIVYDKYVNLFTTNFSHLLDKKMVVLKYNDFQQILNKIYKKSSQDLIVILKWIYSECRKNEIIRNDISADLEPSNIISRVVERVVFEDSFVKSLWAKYYEDKNQYVSMILILFYTGMRVNEILKIKNSNIFIDKKYFITGSKTKAGKNRIIPIHTKILMILTYYKDEYENFLFENTTKRKLTYYFERLMKEYNLKGNLHSIRHTFITKMQRLNDSVSKTQKIVGHASSNVTDGVYTHWSVSDLLQTINKLEY